MKTDPPKACRGCTHRLPHGTCNDPVSAGLADTWGIVWAPAGFAAKCHARQPRETMQKVTPMSNAEAE